jgi:hypothetical protein
MSDVITQDPIYKTDALIAQDIDAYLDAASAQDDAALHHLRVGG